MARLIRILAVLLVGTVIGLALTRVAVGRRPPFGAVRSGPWRAWPNVGTAEADPYARAVLARSGAVPLAAAAGLVFVAERDDAGRPLDARCSYEVGGPTPQAQFWTLTPLDPAGLPLRTGAGRPVLTSADVVRDAAGGFSIRLAAQAQPGNWLPLPGTGPFTLMASFYDTPLTAALGSGGTSPNLPGIARMSCP